MTVLARLERSDMIYHHSLDEQPDTGTRHCHVQYELYFFISGSGEYYVEGSRIHLNPYTLVLLRPGAFHYFHLTGSSPYERCALHFSAGILPDEGRDFLLEGFGRSAASSAVITAEPPVFLVQRYPELIAAFSRLDRASLLPDDESKLMSRAILVEILTLLIGCRRRPHQNDQPSSMITRTLVSEIVDYLNAHLAEHLSLDQLAGCFFVSKYHLCRTFKRATGATVLEYLTQKRIIQARSLLQQGLSPNLVACQCGFTDYSAFYRAFRQLTGYAPSQCAQDIKGSFL